MTEEESFNQIDFAIGSFLAKEGLDKGFKVDKDPHSDWLVYKWRQLNWTEKGIDYLIEIYPTFDEQEKIAGWNLYAAACYDLDKKRYYLNKQFAENKTIDEIAQQAEILISESYKYLNSIKRDEIPFAVHLSG